jgi:hypothetical protein
MLIDTKDGKNAGRYSKDDSGIPQKGRMPPKVPKADWGKFIRAAGKLL